MSEWKAIVETIVEQARIVLDMPDLSPDEDFLAAGLDSVLAVELADRVTEAIGVDIPVAFLYTHPTAGHLAELATEMSGEDGDVRGA